MNTNQRYNQTAIKQFRKELASMLDDITDIDIKILNRAVNEGVKVAKDNTPVGSYSSGKIGGFMRKSWRSTPAVKSKGGGASKTIVNGADYSSFVNDGHRIVNSAGETIGFVKGQFILEKAIGKVNRELVKQFKEEVERVNREHDK